MRHHIQEIEARIRKHRAGVLKASFREFVKDAWPIVRPGIPFVGGYHIDAICEHLQAAYNRDILKLLINVPPRHAKSSLCGVLYPAWVWANNPSESFLAASYSLSLSVRDAKEQRRLVESEWYRELFPHVRLADDENTQTTYTTTMNGKRQTTSTGGTVTGLGGTFTILDDPHNVSNIDSAAMRESDRAWFREAWYNRVNDPKRSIRLVIMQRLHAGDISAMCIEEGGWEHLVLPMLHDSGRRHTTSIGWEDPRKKDGEVLWQEQFTPNSVADLRKSIGEHAFSGQYQQTPVPRGGGLFQKTWFRFWYNPDLGEPDHEAAQLPDGTWIDLPQAPLPTIRPENTAQSWDMTFKGGKKSDFVVGQVWGIPDDSPAHRYLLDQERGRWDLPATLDAVRRLSARWPSPRKYVEDRANGAAAMATLQKEIQGMLAVQPSGGKESRAAAASATFESGCVWFPHPRQFPWVMGLLDEFLFFPRGTNDDQVDACTQALNHMAKRQSQLVAFDVGENVGMYRDSPFSE
jgi:predicted phage terminase large subunit-like protein